MKKIISLFCLLLIVTFTLNSYRSKESPKDAPAAKMTETEKKLLGKWKFLYTDAAKEIPPEDLTYSFLEDHTCMLEYTGEKGKKEKIEVTFEANNGILQTLRDGTPSKEFQIRFEDENTVRLTEKDSKNSMVLERVRE